MKNYLFLLCGVFALFLTSCEKDEEQSPALSIIKVLWERISDYSFEIDTHKTKSYYLSGSCFDGNDNAMLPSTCKVEKISDTESRFIFGARTLYTITQTGEFTYKLVLEQDAHTVMPRVTASWKSDISGHEYYYSIDISYKDGCWNPIY